MSLDISTYSLIALSRGALPLLERRGGGSILTLTYLGSERVFENYNVMGVAKAALEATVRYLAADLGQRASRTVGTKRSFFISEASSATISDHPIPYIPVAWYPPSTISTSAVTARAAELSRNMAASATSVVSTVRRSGARSR